MKQLTEEMIEKGGKHIWERIIKKAVSYGQEGCMTWEELGPLQNDFKQEAKAIYLAMVRK